jgi:hypothetical protein
MMKRLPTGRRTLAILFLISFAGLIQAQTTSPATKPVIRFGYDAAREITIVGTVTRVILKASPGMIAGSHLLLATPSGLVDASLGRFGLRGAGAVSVAAGESIEASGVMQMTKDRSLFLVRTIKVGAQIYTIRNQHGFPVSPQARERAVHQKSQNGESL